MPLLAASHLARLPDEAFEFIVRHIGIEPYTDPMFGAQVVWPIYGFVRSLEVSNPFGGTSDVATVEFVDIEITEHVTVHIERQKRMFPAKELLERHLFTAARQ